MVVGKDVFLVVKRITEPESFNIYSEEVKNKYVIR